MVYFHFFEVESTYDQQRSENYEEPWVSYTEDVNRVNYNITDEERRSVPLTFEILSDGIFLIL